MPASSCSSWKPAGAGATTVPDKFPAGLRVLVVDDDPTCLMILEKMLKKCNYEATICSRAKVGLSLLRENKNGHDIVLSDVHMPDMDGFKLLEQIGLEMELPVIMMSADDSKNVVMKGVTHGACDYLIKPVRIEALRNIWQHVVRRRKWKDFEPLANPDDVDAVAVADEQQTPPEEDGGCSSSGNESQSLKNSKRKKEDGYETEEREESSVKKSRMAWSLDLHQQFVAAVNQLGIDKAVPKKILELMNVQRLTRENVASHLQKYRLYLRRLSGTQNLGSINPSFMGSHDLQPRTAASQLAGSQLTGQSLAKLQSAILHRSNSLKSPISVPGIDQRNVFNFETPKLLHGIPTNMEPKQFMGLNRSYNGVNSQILFPIPGQNQTRIQNQSNINLRNLPRGGNVPNYNYLNEFNDPSSYSSGKKPGFFPEEIGSFHNGFSQVNQDELVSSILKQQQEAFGLPENEFGFDECLDDDDFPQ